LWLTEQVPSTSGTYILIINVPSPVDTTVGKLGKIAFPSGSYAYVGSALGPGGLAARLGRYNVGPNRKHWHINYLLDHAELVGVLFRSDDRRRECAWAGWVMERTPCFVLGFGSSDCRCESHLFFVGDDEKVEEISRAAGCELKASITIGGR